MIIHGLFIADAPYFLVTLKSKWFEEKVWLLADTGAARTTILDLDLQQLDPKKVILEPAPTPLIGIGGSVRSFVVQDVDIVFESDKGDFLLYQDIWAIQHDLNRLPPEEVSRILRLPSVLGRDIINRFRFMSNYSSGEVKLEST